MPAVVHLSPWPPFPSRPTLCSPHGSRHGDWLLSAWKPRSHEWHPLPFLHCAGAPWAGLGEVHVHGVTQKLPRFMAPVKLEQPSSHGRHPPAASPCRRPENAATTTSSLPPQNSSPGSPPHRVLRSICAVPTHIVVLVFGTAPCRVIALRSSTVYAPHFAGSAQPQHRRRSPSVRRRRSLLIPHRLCSPVINCVYVLFLFCLWRRETPCLGEGKSFNARRMFGAMHKSESPSSLQTPIGFVYGEPMYVALGRLD
jgi:hypothetical protein